MTPLEDIRGATRRWHGVELRHLEAFVAVADERSFRRAAERLGFARSVVSQRIRTLELRVSERLVDRSAGAHRVELTPAGALLRDHALAILARVAAAERDFVDPIPSVHRSKPHPRIPKR